MVENKVRTCKTSGCDGQARIGDRDSGRGTIYCEGCRASKNPAIYRKRHETKASLRATTKKSPTQKDVEAAIAAIKDRDYGQALVELESARSRLNGARRKQKRRH